MKKRKTTWFADTLRETGAFVSRLDMRNASMNHAWFIRRRPRKGKYRPNCLYR